MQATLQLNPQVPAYLMPGFVDTSHYWPEDSSKQSARMAASLASTLASEQQGQNINSQKLNDAAQIAKMNQEKLAQARQADLLSKMPEGSTDLDLAAVQQGIQAGYGAPTIGADGKYDLATYSANIAKNKAAEEAFKTTKLPVKIGTSIGTDTTYNGTPAIAPVAAANPLATVAVQPQATNNGVAAVTPSLANISVTPVGGTAAPAPAPDLFQWEHYQNPDGTISHLKIGPAYEAMQKRDAAQAAEDLKKEALAQKQADAEARANEPSKIDEPAVKKALGDLGGMLEAHDSLAQLRTDFKALGPNATGPIAGRFAALKNKFSHGPVESYVAEVNTVLPQIWKDVLGISPRGASGWNGPEGENAFKLMMADQTFLKTIVPGVETSQELGEKIFSKLDGIIAKKANTVLKQVDGSVTARDKMASATIQQAKDVWGTNAPAAAVPGQAAASPYPMTKVEFSDGSAANVVRRPNGYVAWSSQNENGEFGWIKPDGTGFVSSGIKDPAQWEAVKQAFATEASVPAAKPLSGRSSPKAGTYTIPYKRSLFFPE